MKSIFSIIFFALMFCSFNAEAKYNVAEPCTIRIKLCYILTGKVGTKPTCTGIGLGCLKMEHCDRTGDLNLTPTVPGTTNVIFEMLSPGSLSITFLYSGSTTPMLVDADRVMSSAFAADFGYRSIVIQRGNYPVTKNSDGTYTAVLKVITQ